MEIKTILVFIFIIVLIATSGIGIARFGRMDNAMRVVVILLIAQLASEIVAYSLGVLQKYQLRYTMYHVYNIVEMFLQALFFIYVLKPLRNKKLITINAVLWPTIGLLNILLFEPINSLNKNFIMIESFSTITLSLYFIYWLLKSDATYNVFRYPHFWVAVSLLLIWSANLFFWAFVKILYEGHWQYILIAMHVQVVINIIAYIGIGFVLFYYPKQLSA